MTDHTHSPDDEQSTHEVIKDALPEGVEHLSLTPSNRPTAELDLGDSIDPTDVAGLTADIVGSLYDAGLPVEDTLLKAGYRGACDTALVMIVFFEDGTEIALHDIQ